MTAKHTYRLYLCSLLGAFCFWLGCSTVKKSTADRTQITDTAQIAHSQKQTGKLVTATKDHKATTNYTGHTEKTGDSLAGEAPKHIADVVPHAELSPAITGTGRKVPHSYHKKQNGIEVYAVIDTAGNLEYGCNTDSFTYAYHHYTYIHDSSDAVKQMEYDSLAQAYTAIMDSFTGTHRHIQLTDHSTAKVKTRSFWAAHWYLIVIAVVILLLMGLAKRYDWPAIILKMFKKK